jgi:23S rRNA (cytosine1962-C5)-methyltransferase
MPDTSTQNLPVLQLPLNLKQRLSQGHHWVYRNQLGEGQDPRLAAGSWVQVRCGSFNGFGLWDNSGPIAVRLFSSTRRPDYPWLLAQVAQAWEGRARLRRPDPDGN